MTFKYIFTSYTPAMKTVFLYPSPKLYIIHIVLVQCETLNLLFFSSNSDRGYFKRLC